MDGRGPESWRIGGACKSGKARPSTAVDQDSGKERLDSSTSQQLRA